MGEEKKEEEASTIIKVGKLGKNVYNPKPEDVKESQSDDIRIGRINTDNLFKEAEENSEELLNICKPGKSEQKLSPVLRRSESNLTSDMQKKYQQQVARNQSLRREKSDVVVVSVQDGKISDARNSFFQSMMTNAAHHHYHHLDLAQAFSQLVLIHLLNLRFTKLQAEKEKICSKDVLRSMKNHLNLWRQSPQQPQPSLLKNHQFPPAHLRCCLELTSRRLKMSLKN